MATLSIVLLTPEPHYIPGYTGYCPQLKFSMGKTYGRHTAELLDRPELGPSAHLLRRTGSGPPTALTGVTDTHLKKVIPGYTGFIPRSQNYFSRTFSDICDKAQAEFHRDTEASNLRSTRTPAIVNGNQSERPKLPLVAVTNKAVSYKPVSAVPPVTLSPYSMDDQNQHKYFISGFTGHVPKSRFLLGKGFPIITNEALVLFGRQQSRDPASQHHPPVEQASTRTTAPNIYRSKSGMVPSFTGHIPGQKFLFGQTFGRLSREAVEQMRVERRLREES